MNEYTKNFEEGGLAFDNDNIEFSYIDLNDETAGWVNAKIPVHEFEEWAKENGYFDWSCTINIQNEVIEKEGKLYSFDEFNDANDRRFVYQRLIEYYETVVMAKQLKQTA